MPPRVGVGSAWVLLGHGSGPRPRFWRHSRRACYCQRLWNTQVDVNAATPAPTSCTARWPTRRRWPSARRASSSPTRRAGSTSMPRAAPRCPAWAMATPRCWPRCTRSSTGWPMRIPASSPAQPAEELAELLVRDAPAGTSHAYFVSGGSEAMEAALKMARQYFVEMRPAAAPALHRAAAELPRQHAGRAGGGRQRLAAQAVRAAADRGDARGAVLRIPRPPVGRKRRGLRRCAWWPSWPRPSTGWAATG